MAKASDNEFPSVLFTDGTADPATPSANTARIFVKDDSGAGLYLIDDAGSVTGPLIDATSAGATALSGLDDVGTATPTDGQVLSYSTADSLWVPAASSGGATALSELDDVGTATPSDGQVLTYSTASAEWGPATASGGGGGATWDEYLLSDNAPGGTDDDEFEDASLDGSWTAVNPTGTATWTEANSLMSVLYSGQSSSDFSCLLKPITSPSAPMTAEVALRSLGDNNYSIVGVAFTDGTATSSNVVAFTQEGSNVTIRHGTITGATSSALNIAAVQERYWVPWLYMRLKWTATNTFTWEMSPDGVSWTSLGVGTTSVTLSPTHVGLVVSRWGGSNESVASFQYMRLS